MDQKQALVERLKEANNILVTVSNNPSVDQLASCIGLTLALNKLNKHATAVFSGEVPETIEFLHPDKTIEKNTDSLRDFIIALDKSKADKLRYKVEDKVVKIFITPYRTSITDKDLEFSQGDFNVDAVVAIGVHSQGDLDQAITAHGRILHDATVTTINVAADGQIGTINWIDPAASSLSELVTEAITDLGTDILDEQMSTALLTGIVAETKRFSNDKTTPTTMTISAELMAAGANQQLVATKLEPPKPVTPPPPALQPMQEMGPRDQPFQQPLASVLAPVPLPSEPPKPDDGTLEIAHDPLEALKAMESPSEEPEPEAPQDDTPADEPAQPEEPKDADIAQIHIDDQGALQIGNDAPAQLPELKHEANTDPTRHMGQHIMMEPPSMGGGGNMDEIASSGEERPAGDPIGITPQPTGLLQRSDPFAPAQPQPLPMPRQPDMNPYPSPFTPDSMQSSVPAQQPQSSQDPITPQPMMVTPTVPQPTPFASVPTDPGQTLSEIEQNVNSPHAQQYAPRVIDADSARDAALQAIASQPEAPTPIQALNAQPLGMPLHDLQQSDPQQGTGPMLPQQLGQPGMNLPPPGPPPMMPPAA